MIQRIFIPQTSRVRQIVNFMSYVEFTVDDCIDGWIAIFPNATSNMVITLNAPFELDDNTAQYSLYASCASTVALKPAVGLRFVTVQLNHFGLFALSGIPANELSDTLIALDTLFKRSELDILTDEIRHAASYTRLFGILETFFLSHCPAETLDSKLPFVTRLLKSDPNMRMDSVGSHLCMSNRGLYNLFQKHVGMSPSQFKKIMRFNHAANALLHSSSPCLTDVAADCGYFDQAHFIKDFRQIARISPSEFLQLKAKRADFYNYNLKDIATLGVN